MREFKFRQWDSRRKIMHTGVGASQGTWSGFPYCSWDVYPIMQYTGLKDKNGKEIYEGDIVIIEDTYKERILDDGSGPVEPVSHLAPVTFEYAEFGMELVHGADIFHSGFWSFADVERETGQNEFEVIGNIYENPELVKEK